VSDPHAKHTVLELINTEKRIFPIGRLDKNTTGLLILTNDGELTQKLTHPSFEKEKEYEVSIEKPLSNENIKKIEKGIPLEDGVTLPVKIKKNKSKQKNFIYSIIIKEGRNRQIRRMFEKIGHPVMELKRERVGRLTLGNLKMGKWRRLIEKEIKNLYGKRN